MKVLLVGLTFAAAVVGGSIGYASLVTGTNPVEYLSKDGVQQVINRGSESSGSDGDLASGAGNRGGDTEVTEREVSRRSEPRVEPGPEDIVISEDELNQRVTDAITNGPYPVAILDIAKEVNTKLENDRIESGMTINFGESPIDELPAETQAAVEQLIATFPFLADRDVYLGIEGHPTVVDGAVKLEDANIKLGSLKLPASSVASELGVSQSGIEQQINTVLEQQGLIPEDIQVVDGQLIIITGLS